MWLDVVWEQEQSCWTWTKYRSNGNLFCVIWKKLLETGIWILDNEASTKDI